MRKKGTYKKDEVIASIIDMRLNKMCSTKTIIDFLMSMPMSKPQAYDYLKWAREEIKDQYSLTNPSMIEEAIGQYEEALESARSRKDWRLWNDLKKELNKIMGIYATQKIDVTSGGDKLTGITFEIITKKQDGENEDTQHQGD
jgi:hypothetical protein